MRLVEVLTPQEKRDAVGSVLDGEGIDYPLVQEESRDEPSVVITFPLPMPAVESVLDELRDTGIDEDSYTVVVDAETAISDRFDELEQRYAQNSPRISREERQAQAKDLTPSFGTYLVMTATSVVVATAGLLLDSAAVVVGSMVIAPLIGPALGASVGTVVDDQHLDRPPRRVRAARRGRRVHAERPVGPAAVSAHAGGDDLERVPPLRVTR